MLRTVSKAWSDRILGLSAEAAFWQLLSLPSLFLALLATLGYFAGVAGGDTVNRVETSLLSGFSRAFSPQVVDQLIRPLVRQVLSEGRGDVLSISFPLALWAGSSATATFVNTITIAYGMRDMRGAVRSRLLALGIYLGSIVIGVIALPALVIGPGALVRLFPAADRRTAAGVIDALYWPVIVLMLLVGLTSLYHLSPPRRLPWRRGVPGAFLAVAIFLLGSTALRAYIRFIVAHNHAYGTLAAPIAALLFFFVLALGVLLGAEFNAAIEDQWPTPVRSNRGERKWRRLEEPESAPEREPRSAEGGATGQSEPPPAGIDS